MKTTMDENTVTANLVTFVNCLSLSERKAVTSFLFDEKNYRDSETKELSINLESIRENLEIIKKAKKVIWEISYHTQVFPGCEPDVVIHLDNETFYIEVKTRVGTGFTPSEKKSGAREANLKEERHVYLIPSFYDYSEKMKKSPVCYWNDLKQFLNDDQIECNRFFSEIGKHIDYFLSEQKAFTKGELAMIYEPNLIYDSIQTLIKMNKLITETDDLIIKKLNESENNFSTSDFHKHYSAKFINYKNQKLGYGLLDTLFDTANYDKDVISKFIFCVWFNNELVKNHKGINGKDYIINSYNNIFYPIDRKILAIEDYEELKNAYIDAVTSRIKEVMKLNDIQ